MGSHFVPYLLGRGTDRITILDRTAATTGLAYSAYAAAIMSRAKMSGVTTGEWRQACEDPFAFRPVVPLTLPLEGIGQLGNREAEAFRIAVLARSSFADGALVEAVARARRAVSVDPTNARLHELIADCLGALGRNDEALDSLDLALITAVSGVTSNGQRGRLYRKMGEAYERQGRGDRANEAYHRAIELVPEDTIASERLRSISRGHERIPNGS